MIVGRLGSSWLAPAIVAPALMLLSGCGLTDKARPKEHDSKRALSGGTTAKVGQRQSADVQIAIARTLEQSGRPEEAESAYRDALKNDPRRGDAHARLAILCNTRGDFKAGDKQLAEAIHLEPRNPEYHCDLGYSLYVQRRWTEAEASFRKAIALDARHARSHNNLGLVLARQAHADEALAEFARAGCDPSDARANLGLILADEGRFADAKAAYAKAVELKPTSTVALRGLQAATVASSGDPSAARALAQTPPPRDDALLRTSTR